MGIRVSSLFLLLQFCVALICHIAYSLAFSNNYLLPIDEVGEGGSAYLADDSISPPKQGIRQRG